METIKCFIFANEETALIDLLKKAGTMYGCSIGYRHTYPSTELLIYDILCINAQSAFNIGMLIERTIVSNRLTA